MSTRSLLGLVVLLAVPVLLATTLRHADGAKIPAAPAAAPPVASTTSAMTVVIQRPAANAAGAVDAADAADSADEPEEGEEHDESIPVSAIPDVVLQAALAALPGLEISEAECEHSDAGLSYDLEGTVGGKRMEIAVSADGSIQEIEAADDDD